MEIKKFANTDQMAQAAAELVLTSALAAVIERGVFSLVLAGGGTPLPLYRRLAAPPFLAQMPWELTHLFQGDERCLPPEHPDSNFGRAAATLLAPGQVPADNIHRMTGEDPDPKRAAAAYQRQIEDFCRDFAVNSFDLVLLGMGSDGHIASLFPGSALLAEQDRLVAAETEPAGNPPVPRLTLTLPAINSARRVLLLTSGPEKEKIMNEIIADRQAAAARYPAARVMPSQEFYWLRTISDE
ncbi:6-phosphogluconolactonase [Desulfurivibrio alkaliphilus]|uniref:6-phosphogluconolactonase n=1 Tax=Desulfurivibrio alkaliphilus (strain DSM 19089 / UNIQEM U267 / AHT2) TaxID=589865 RepID=D6Z2B2_DESAT|nr:6-phosphogluconolactonase [Desulfurivibrio alkaliphilus]ADH85687.1 6-phosphogluconolactonase [Desulfurivibrio alkaliphilus AHT 2]